MVLKNLETNNNFIKHIKLFQIHKKIKLQFSNINFITLINKIIIRAFINKLNNLNNNINSNVTIYNLKIAL